MIKIALFGVGLAAALGLGATFACSSEPTLVEVPDGEGDTDASPQRDGSVYDSAPSPESGLGELLFRPNRVFTGLDGTHSFKVPVAVYDSASDLSVTADDPFSVTITASALKNPVNAEGVTDNGTYFLLTASKAGTYTLAATSKGRARPRR